MTLLNAVSVQDPADPRIEVFRGLRDKALRQRRESPGGDMAGVFIAEGDLVIDRAIAAGYRLLSVLVDAKRSNRLPDAFATVPVYAAGPSVLEHIAGYQSYRGALACFERRTVPHLHHLLADLTLRSFVLIEGINNPTNLGMILRCAAGLGIDAVLLAPNACDPLSRRCCRVSMGEAFALPYAWLDDIETGFVAVRTAGVEILALTPNVDAVPLSDLVYSRSDRVGVLLGAEGPGLSDEAMAAADRRVAIPMSGPVDSINVGAAAAIAFYALQQART